MTIKFSNKVCFMIILSLIIKVYPSAGQQMNFIQPTGTYILKGKSYTKEDEIYGYFGTIQVKALSDQKIAISFYICKGAPSYNSGSFVDTLDYANNIAIYKEYGCTTMFKFTMKGIEVKEKNHGDCWGQGVYADGYFRKQSARVPEIKDLTTD